MAIPGLENLSLMELGKRTFKGFQSDDMLTYASALAYRILLALFPFMIFLLTVLEAFGLTDFFNWLLDQAENALPSDAYSQVETIIEQIRGGASGGLLSFGLVAAIWAAGGGVRAVMKALNVAYDVQDTRPIWKLYPMSIVYTLGLAVLLIASVALMLLGPQAMEWLADHINLGDLFVTLWTWLRIPVAVALMVIAVALIYHFFPNVEQSFRIITPGSVFAVAVWMLATYGFSIYVSNFGNYNATYGSIGGVIVLMLYFYLSAAVLLLGAEVNAVIFKSRHDTENTNVEASEFASEES